MQKNQYQQPIGEALPHFRAGERPNIHSLQGQYCRLEKLGIQHLEDLWTIYNTSTPAQNWTYLPEHYGPFHDKNTFTQFVQHMENSTDPYYLAIIDPNNNTALGSLALMRIDTQNRVIEVGAIIYSEALKRTRIATEAQYLLAQYIFEHLHYRRYEWKCDSLNAPSRQAAQRLGFRFEGIFRQALVYKQRNRDTAWYSMLDTEWPHCKARLLTWLSPNNFDEQGQQKRSLTKED